MMARRLARNPRKCLSVRGILVLKGHAVTYQRVNTEMVNDRAKLLMHRLVARRISQQPELIETVKRTLSTGPRSLSSSQEWLEILERTPEEVRKMITSRSSQMTRLRVSSPFFSVADLKDPTIRKRVWKIAKKGKTPKMRTVV